MKAEVSSEEVKNEEIKEELEMNEPQPGQLFTIDVLRVTKSAQNQYGLRHGTYQRYRNYCTRRLLRLRKSLNLTNGGKRYQKRVLKEDEVKSVRHLYIPLVQAERAWSYAMQLKDEARIDEIPPRVKFHIIRRFTKAVKWCNTLSSLSKNKVDSKTALEIEAYECWMTGILLLEKEDWKNSLNASVKARTIYEQMVKMGDSDEQELFNERVNEIDISLRYCNFQLGGGSTEDIKSLISSNQGGGLDLLQAKLENALKDSRKKQSQSLEKITWRGRTAPIKSEKLRVSLLNCQEQAFELESKADQEEKINLYSQLFSSYSESLEIIKNELRAIANSKEQKSGKVEQEESNLQYLLKYINFLKVSKTIERNELLVSSLKSNLGFGKKGKKTKPDDLVRIYDSLIQNIAELEVLSDKEDVENVKLLASRSLFYKSFRCFYLSLSFSYSNDWGKALVLLDRCAIRIQDAKDHFLECNKNYDVELQQLENLIKSVRSEKSVINSRAYLHSLNGSSLDNDEKKEAPHETTISECLDEFVQVSTVSKLANFPPEFRPAPCKPVLFDLAQVEIAFPDLEARKQKKSFWRWW